jgi:hypothetical protein
MLQRLAFIEYRNKREGHKGVEEIKGGILRAMSG